MKNPIGSMVPPSSLHSTALTCISADFCVDSLLICALDCHLVIIFYVFSTGLDSSVNELTKTELS